MDISCHDCRLRKGSATVLTGAIIFGSSCGKHLAVAEGWDRKEGLVPDLMDFVAFCLGTTEGTKLLLKNRNMYVIRHNLYKTSY